eukprot:1194646-Prorocentrum_minimum.AAC.4
MGPPQQNTTERTFALALEIRVSSYTHYNEGEWNVPARTAPTDLRGPIRRHGARRTLTGVPDFRVRGFPSVPPSLNCPRRRRAFDSPRQPDFAVERIHEYNVHHPSTPLTPARPSNSQVDGYLSLRLENTAASDPRDSAIRLKPYFVLVRFSGVLNLRVITMDVSIDDMKVPQLKEELAKRGLSTKGLKKELVARLTEAVNAAQVGQGDLADAGAAVVGEALDVANSVEVSRRTVAVSLSAAMRPSTAPSSPTFSVSDSSSIACLHTLQGSFGVQVEVHAEEAAKVKEAEELNAPIIDAPELLQYMLPREVHKFEYKIEYEETEPKPEVDKGVQPDGKGTG